MAIQTIGWLSLIGFLAGSFSGLLGVGGGIILVPALVLLAGFSQQQAQGTSLGVLCLPVGILAVRQYYQKGLIPFRMIGVIAIGYLLGAGLGSYWAVSISPEKVKQFFALILFLAGGKMLQVDKMLFKKFRK